MTPDAKIATYLRAILRADDLDKAKQEARLALKLIETHTQTRRKENE